MLSTAVKNLYNEGRISTRQMIWLQFGSGIYGFIARNEPLMWEGVEYKPFGLIEVSDLGSGTGTTADGSFTLTLAESPDDGLTPAVLVQIENEDYRDRPVRVMDAHFHPDTGELIQVETVARGYLDVVEHAVDPERGYVLAARCEGRQLDYSRKNGRVRSTADQQRRAPGDKFFEHAGRAGRVEVLWGKPGSSNVPSGSNYNDIFTKLISN
ncbi:hypothetical protein ABID21_001934 [Pseudorhizobium tarimense]|uniref:Uncharacterized protein n=1 Tax=Pseudorhizobium tarimense TaxID=1079109 RepID=A0ABV2H5J5_9HYPH|nr:DUF2163 domain-containing protein [Pseudorhizobium tarimense]MCJ8519026.1 DUF2163 domain-containing protein [Pseudorhizobium tarimense]